MRKQIAIAALCCLLLGGSGLAIAQSQGSSGPVFGGLPLIFDGPGYIEVLGAHSELNGNNPSWTDAGVIASVSGGRNTIHFESTRQDRYGDVGWWFSAGATRTFGENWYATGFLGSSVGGVFLPRLRGDAFINRKFLPHKQLVLNFGAGFDNSKLANHDYRNSVGGIYYFPWPVILQAEVEWTRSLPDGTLVHTQKVALTQGREKEHYITARAEIGREAYEVVGQALTLFDFPIHNYSLNYKQWLGANFGVHLTLEREVNPFYRRNGGSVAFFLDF